LLGQWALKNLFLGKNAAGKKNRGYTPPKTNMEPENEPLEEEIPMKNHHFRFHVSFRGCILGVAPFPVKVANEGFFRNPGIPY